MIADLEVYIRDVRLLLTDELAVVWPDENLLLIADWHLGKSDVFGRRGIPIPEGSTATDLERLSALCAQYRVAQVLVLGDLMHAPPAEHDRWPSELAGWLSSKNVAFGVVAGNHDRISAQTLPAVLKGRIDWHPGHLDVGPFRLCHEPETQAGHYVLAGHLHPTRRMSGQGDRLRAPAYWFRKQYGVLPAFGSFTGGMNIKPARDDRVFVAGPGAVVEMR